MRDPAVYTKFNEIFCTCYLLPWLISELQTFRTQYLSFPRTKGPYGELSFPRNESSRNFRSRALSFPGTFVPGERKFLGTFVPGTFRTRELSSPYLCALVYNSSLGAARLCLWCAYNCVTALKTLEVGLMSVSLSTGIVTFIHFAFLFNKKTTRTHIKLTLLLSLFLENKHY